MACWSILRLPSALWYLFTTASIKPRSARSEMEMTDACHVAVAISSLRRFQGWTCQMMPDLQWKHLQYIMSFCSSCFGLFVDICSPNIKGETTSKNIYKPYIGHIMAFYGILYIDDINDERGIFLRTIDHIHWSRSQNPP